MWNHVTTHLYPWAVSSTQPTLPWWSWIVFVVDFILLLPAILLLSYTVQQVFLSLAIIEDQNPPPAYRPVPLNDDAANAGGEPDANINKNINDPLPVDKPVTTSMRATHKLLRSHGGFAALFRGFWCIFAYGIIHSVLTGVFAAFMGFYATRFVSLLSMLCLVQLGTAWVHIVITPKSPLHFWQRLPPFGKTIRATALATTLFFSAKEISSSMPLIVAYIFGVPMPDFSQPPDTVQPPKWEELSDAQRWVGIPIAVTSILTRLLLVIPAQVILVRVQASLLPPEEHTIVPFDHSFGGRVEPALVGGRGYASIKDAWVTFKCSSWKRLFVMCFKIFLLQCLFMVVVFAIMVPEFLLMHKFAPGEVPGKN